MKLENEFTVPASIDQAWAVLLDVPRVAPCLPGATVEPGGGEDGVFKGAMKIKIGPITASYKGTVKIQEADEVARRVAMKAQAKDARGQGTAAATITSTMRRSRTARRSPSSPTCASPARPPQFGRGVMQDVSAKLMGRFADCLAEEMRSDGAASAEPEAEAPVAEAPRPPRRPRRRARRSRTPASPAPPQASPAPTRSRRSRAPPPAPRRRPRRARPTTCSTSARPAARP